MDLSLTLEVILMLTAVAAVAGFIDAIAGGGGLLTIPAMLLANIPPVLTLGTNKLQAASGALTASITMIKKGVVSPSKMKLAIAGAFIGSVLGTIAVQMSPPDMLEKLIPFLIAAIGIYTLFAPSLGEVEAEPRVSESTWQRVVAPLIGFYDGYVGPGTGMFFALGNVALRGRQIIAATGAAKVLNLSTNIASLIFFIIGGNVLWKVGLAMMVGQTIGAYAGSHMVVKGGSKIIRPVIVLVCLAMVTKYMMG
ncbi:TSUP family transporter [Psychrobacter sanguinis]|uniref:TSUP family transporter n=1 Tax=Psychrobacter sanguinis TaxID=861445 RepID=UPI0019181E73|nr:TSUP family transporter [Psychrobacter sanguinis]MCC3308635.1 TSUP family transporter [Psychrobacter sanguinis]MCC3346091.1 TSUP family transporter [Psychrobacter sanguinis]MDY3307331.1 TSUP family transporter [Psychrobacter sanguinis]UEC25923.1 TSUP family transporter [Psychrobacter sanguinis]